MGFVQARAKEAGIECQFLQANSATVNLGTPVDLLFIDTWHVYGHLKRELDHHHANVQKYIIMHDTEGDAVLGESVRFWSDFGVGDRGSRGLKAYVKHMADAMGYTEDEASRGLHPAIDEFLVAHPEWSIHAVFTNNNGLTILKKS